MKEILAILAFFSFQFLNAQTTADPARTATDALVIKYKLDAKQTEEMYRIQTRRFQTLEQLEAYRADAKQYTMRKISLDATHSGSIRLLLTTPEQIETYRLTRVEERQKREEKRNQLKTAGKTAEEIELEVMSIWIE